MAHAEIQFHMIQGGPQPVAPFSHATEAGGFVFVTGQMPDTPDAPGRLPEGIEAQTLNVMNNLATVLRGLGLGWGDVVMARAYLTRFKQDYASFNTKPSATDHSINVSTAQTDVGGDFILRVERSGLHVLDTNEPQKFSLAFRNMGQRPVFVDNIDLIQLFYGYQDNVTVEFHRSILQYALANASFCTRLPSKEVNVLTRIHKEPIFYLQTPSDDFLLNSIPAKAPIKINKEDVVRVAVAFSSPMVDIGFPKFILAMFRLQLIPSEGPHIFSICPLFVFTRDQRPIYGDMSRRSAVTTPLGGEMFQLLPNRGSAICRPCAIINPPASAPPTPALPAQPGKT